jgi:hypothetical protein
MRRIGEVGCVVVAKILRSALECLMPPNATTSRTHVVRSSAEVSRAEYSMDSMNRSMKSLCGDVFVVWGAEVVWCV